MKNMLLLGAAFAALTLSLPAQAELKFKPGEDPRFHWANYDELTGLPNRQLLKDRLEQQIVQARREEQVGALLYLDLDRFKEINDIHGHSVGDVVLTQAAERISGEIRESDTVARLGGDEFVVVMPHVQSERQVRLTASRLLERLNESFSVWDDDHFVSASIGIVMFPDDGDSVETLLKNADAAMYRAKDDGRNNYQFYTESMNATAFERLMLEGGLRKALNRDEFVLYYQPQIDMRSGKAIAVEALIRWHHPQRGTLILPDEFIATLERIGLICDLGNWVIHTACAQAASWITNGNPQLRVAVNVSPLHFHDPSLMDTIKDALESSGLSPEHLEIEITEASVQSDTKAMVVLRQLQEIGVRIAIDDFGNGYSSLGSLKHLPINTLKIDPVFVRGMMANNEDAVMLGTIIGLAHKPGIRTNMGVAAYSDEDTRVEIRFFSNFPAFRPLGTITRTVEAESHLQIPRVFEELGLSSTPLVSVSALVRVRQGWAVYAYASTVDNGSGDPTTLVATRND